jgi:hypothetical protein
MALEDILAGIGGGVKGALDAYSWQKQQQADDEDRELNRERIRAEIQTMLARVSRAPDDPAEAVDTVDEQGNPVTQYIPRSQLGGRTFKKPTTAPKPEPTPKPVQITTIDERGRPVTRFVDPKPGDSFPVYVKPPEPKEPRDEPVEHIQTVDEDGNPIEIVVPRSQAVNRSFTKPAKADPDYVPEEDPNLPGMGVTKLPNYGKDIRLPSSRPGRPLPSTMMRQTPVNGPLGTTASQPMNTGRGGGSAAAAPKLPQGLVPGSPVKLRDGRTGIFRGVKPDGSLNVEF